MGMKRWCSWILLLALLVVPAVRADAEGSAVLALGADLSASQRATVLSEMGITEAEAAAYETIYITNDMEHQYLDESLGASVVGTHALSSVLLIPQESGAGLSVETHNVNFCTIAMYRNALLTAGVQDAKVIVAAPSSISGTAALVGALKAYETYSGETVSEDAFSVATDELVLTGELMDELDSEQISDLIAYLKQQIAERGLDDPDKLSEVVRQASDEMDLKLTDEQVSQIVDLLLKLNKLDIDPGKLASQAKELYDKLDSLGIDLDTEKVGNFITRFVSSIWDLIQGFMSRS
jgi:Predicted secreted protein